MSTKHLADLVERELGTVPEPMLQAQARRWEKAIRLGPVDARRPSRTAALLAVAAAMATMVVVAVVGLPGSSSEPIVVPSSGVLSAARAYEFDIAAEDTLRHIELAPSEVLTVSPGARGKVERDSEAATLVTLREGAMSLSVPSGTGRSWAVAAGPYRIDVVGTEFSVTWLADTQQLAVTVERGVVRVTGEGMTSPRVLEGGERLVRGPVAETAPEEDPAPPGTSSPRPASSATPEPGWRELQQQRRYSQALAAAEREGFDRLCASLSSGELVALANTARLAGSSARAQQALKSVRQRFAGTPDAATAAFLLGREGSSAIHTGWLESYLAEQPGGPYEQEALGRLLVAYRNRGDLARARVKAAAYLSAYPSGAYSEHARSVLGRDAAASGSR